MRAVGGSEVHALERQEIVRRRQQGDVSTGAGRGETHGTARRGRTIHRNIEDVLRELRGRRDESIGAHHVSM